MRGIKEMGALTPHDGSAQGRDVLSIAGRGAHTSAVASQTCRQLKFDGPHYKW